MDNLEAGNPIHEGTPASPAMLTITRHEDCRAILSDWKRFSAVAGDNNAFATFGACPVQPEIDAIMAAYPETPVLMRCDPPAHTRVRRLVDRTLTPDRIRALEPGIEATIAELAAPWLGSGMVEFTAAFAALLPNAVTTRFLGCAPEMRPTFKFWADEVMSRFTGPQAPVRQLEVARNIAAMAQFFFGEIDRRRAAPTDDLISLLTHAEIDGDRLDGPTIVNVIETFLVGGHETTTFLLGNCLWEIARDPVLADALRCDPARIPAFVEEVLRLDAPSKAVIRTATEDVEIGGTSVAAGTTLLVMVAEANRDESVFDTPHDLVIDRPRPSTTPGTRHLSFGYGIHACIGLNLARAEVRLALNYLLPRMRNIAPDGPDPIERLDGLLLRGPTRLSLRFEPA